MRVRLGRLCLLLIAGLTLLRSGSSLIAADSQALVAKNAIAQPIAIPGVHNAFRASERIYSGSQPEGDEGFAAIAKLGVKTIVSVDGSRPDVEAARKHGLRYVHRLHGYDGIPTGWKTPPGQADISPAHETTMLGEQFREIARTDDTAKPARDYRTELAEAEQNAAALRELLRKPTDSAAVDAALKRAGQNCLACHKKYRNE